MQQGRVEGIRSFTCKHLLRSRRHYNHGATVVVLNDGATGDLTNLLSQSIYGCNAIPVYQRFLSGP